MTPSKLIIKADRRWTWEQWQAGHAERRRIGNLVASTVIRRDKSEEDEFLRETYGGERGPAFNKAFDPSADAKR
jgi:hypothetical protein